MARKEYMEGEESIFTLNETKIGAGGGNYKRSDIQLVQFFLRQFFKAHPSLFAKLPKTSKGGGMVTIDGYYGAQTASGILLFQKYMKDGGVSIKTDGLVDVPTGTVSSISQTVYTIHWMNGWFQKWADESGNVEMHSDCIKYAPELRSELLAKGIDDKIH